MSRSRTIRACIKIRNKKERPSRRQQAKIPALAPGKRREKAGKRNHQGHPGTDREKSRRSRREKGARKPGRETIQAFPALKEKNPGARAGKKASESREEKLSRPSRRRQTKIPALAPGKRRQKAGKKVSYSIYPTMRRHTFQSWKFTGSADSTTQPIPVAYSLPWPMLFTRVPLM